MNTQVFMAEGIELRNGLCWLRIHEDDGDPNNRGMAFWQHHEDDCQGFKPDRAARMVAGRDESGPVDSQADYDDLLADFQSAH